jgi:hypothetical protein
MIRCRSKIYKEYKTRKADCVWPNCANPLIGGKPLDVDSLPVCGGNITLTIKAVDEPDYHSGHYAVLQVTATCSRCRAGYFPGMRDLMHDHSAGPLLVRAVEFAEAEGFFDRVCKETGGVA